ncbi:MAG: proline--tRNA ligase [Clostridia bacterium]
MLLSKLVGERVKETPSDVKILSHSLLVRAGFIKAVANGIFSLTSPAQLMSLNIEAIIREEMNKIDGQEVKFPVVMPRELWESSGRYSTIGSEMARFKDRGGKDMLLGMTHEEASVHMVKNTVSSYAQLPCMIYQIQTKFRDEPRCRGGLIRVREFTMKDGYSFHMTDDDLSKYYDKCLEAYHNIFRRIGLKRFISVKSDTGMMGGSIAHEFMLLTDVGEDTLVLCDECGYKANMEVATSKRLGVDFGKNSAMEEVFTADAKDIDALTAYLNIEKTNTIKAVAFAVRGEDTLVVAFIRGDLEVNEAKLKKAVMKNIVPFDAENESELTAGNIGCIGLNSKNTLVVFDKSLEGAYNMVTGANKAEYHIKGVDVSRDVKPKEFVDIAKVKLGEACPICGKPLHLENGIEIGNIFQLGTKYTKSMNMTVLNDKGEAVYPTMGCYGIGVGRAIASIAQESNDEKGLILPMSVAPYRVHICALRIDEPLVKEKAFALYNELKSKGISALIDDRENVSNGVKFADADLMGMPIRVVVSPRGLQNGEMEVVKRSTLEKENVSAESVVARIETIIAEEMEKLK